MDLVFISRSAHRAPVDGLPSDGFARRALWELLSGHDPLRWGVRGAEDGRTHEPPSQGGDGI